MKMATQQSTQLWSLSADPAEYERHRNLLSGRLKNSLDPDSINTQTMEASLSRLSFTTRVEVVHDGCDIRKQHSRALPNLAKVRALDGGIVNGYNTFNSLAISDSDKSIHLLNSTTYSSADPHYNLIAGAGFTYDELVLGQISRCDQALKDKFAGIEVRHLLDRGHDDQKVFEYIDRLGSTFVIRAKANRNSDEFTLTGEGKKKAIKLLDAKLEKSYTQGLLKFVWKSKAYPHSHIQIDQGTLTLTGNAYTVLRVRVFDRSGKAIFKDTMLLVTNESCPDFECCFAVYQAYLRRSKIESVFKFLKDSLGWETFRVHDFMVIQNVIALCFFVAGYFYEHQREITADPQASFICSLANSKGKVTRHFYLEGLKIMANYMLFQEAVREQNVPQKTVIELLSILK